MRSSFFVAVIAAVAAAVGVLLALRSEDGRDGGTTGGRELAALTVDYPLTGSIFPPDFVAPTILWHDPVAETDAWTVEVRFAGADAAPVEMRVPGDPPPRGEIDPDCLGETNEIYEPTPYQASAQSWTPDPTVWETIKQRAGSGRVTLSIRGLDRRQPDRLLSAGSVHFTVSEDPVGAPIFYRDVPLMPSRGETGKIKPLSKSAVPLIAWRLRDVAQPESRVVLRSMPSCANCHSFSLDGGTMGMDVDGPEGDKGAYMIAPVAEHMSVEKKDVITWNSFEDKPKGHRTIGFLSRVSPDGRHVVSTVNEALYVSNFLDYRYLQVFYPTRGILAVYGRDTGEMKGLPGADDPEYVHCDPAWTPDGRALVFARAEARDPYIPGRPLATHPNDPNETPIQYDLYRMPFDEGRGGEPVPIEGASANGMSNTFPKVSPDGKWIVFVKCRNGQLMRPDGRLWIVPVEGGEAREMTCNTDNMNSWHSFSPNSRWMVFSSKTNTPYTQMFLTHIDEEGRDSPAILIPNSTAANRAVNLPEFLNAPYGGLQSIEVPAANHHRDLQRGVEFLEQDKFDEAMACFESALEKDPDFSSAHVNLGRVLAERGRLDDAIRHYEKAISVNPGVPMAYVNLGFALGLKGKRDLAVRNYLRALEIDPGHAMAHNNLGFALFEQGRVPDAIAHYRKALATEPENTLPRKNLGLAHLRQGLPDLALKEYREALRHDPDDPVIHASLARILLDRGDHREAFVHLREMVKLDPENPRTLASLAWQLATCPQEDLRHGEEALALAQKACEATGRRQPVLLEALAAAQAELGRFDDAIATCQAALRLVQPGQAAIDAGIRKRLELYRAGKPYRTGKKP
jgi:tetratricopeptide (TPR) repeat protein